MLNCSLMWMASVHQTPLATILSAILVCPYRPDSYAMRNLKTYSLLELICPFDSSADYAIATVRRESQSSYLQPIAELDHLGFFM